MIAFEPSDRGCVVVKIKTDAGDTLYSDRFRFETASKRQAFCTRANLDEAELIKAYNDFKQTPTPATVSPASDLTVYVRGLNQPTGSSIPFKASPIAALRAALEYKTTEAEPLIHWDKKALPLLCVLDIDYHKSSPPSLPRLLSFAERVIPRPSAWWVTHGGGLHFVYTKGELFTARELASLAALRYMQIDPCATVEIKADTRHPGYKRGDRTCSEVWFDVQSDDDVPALNAWLTTAASESDVSEWLNERGYEEGKAYGHDMCLIDPGRQTRTTTCVFVGETGIHCQTCAAYGISYPGIRKPGWVPYSALGTGRNASRIRKAAEQWCPWAHARYIIEDEYGPVQWDVSRNAYSAILKVVHEAGDPRIIASLCETPFVRGANGGWLHVDTLAPIARPLTHAAVETMPFCLSAWKDEKDEWKQRVDMKRREMLIQAGTIPGWDELIPVRGAKLWGQFRSYASPGIRVVPPHQMGVQYKPAGERISLDAAWDVLEKSFPGVNRNYLLLLLAARGFAESGEGPVPMVLTTGPSGAAKTYTVHLAAEMIGDNARQVKKSDGKISEQIGAVLETSGYALIDEFSKAIRATPNQDMRAAMDDFLLIDRKYSFRKLYVGPITALVTSVIVLTDTSVPQELMQDTQLGRRMVFVRLHSRVPDWIANLRQIGDIGDINGWRTRDRDHQKASEAIVSHVIDEYFADGSTYTFREVATKLGFAQLEELDDCSEGVDRDKLIRDVVSELCGNAPACPATRWKGRGWKLVQAGDSTPLAKAWEEVRDEDRIDSSRIMEEADLAAVLGLATPCKLWVSRRPGTQQIGLRISNNVASQSPDFKVNEELFVVPLPPVEPTVDDLISQIPKFT